MEEEEVKLDLENKNYRKQSYPTRHKLLFSLM